MTIFPLDECYTVAELLGAAPLHEKTTISRELVSVIGKLVIEYAGQMKREPAWIAAGERLLEILPLLERLETCEPDQVPTHLQEAQTFMNDLIKSLPRSEMIMGSRSGQTPPGWLDNTKTFKKKG
jgi:hypothetical protein